jgi:hypothetical protein
VVDWLAVNQHALAAAIGRVRGLLEHACAGEAGSDPPDAVSSAEALPSALAALVERLGLTPFERDVLVLCAGVELDSALAAACSAHDDGAPGAPTFALAFDVLSDPDRRAATPARPLRRWRLVEAADRGSLMRAALRIDEWALHYLQGYAYLDERLRAFVEPVTAPGVLPRSQALVAETAAALWSGADEVDHPHIQLDGVDGVSRLAVAATACAQQGLGLLRVRPCALALAPAERAAVATLCARHALLCGAAVALDGGQHEAAGSSDRISDFLAALGLPSIVLSGETVGLHAGPVVRLSVPRPILLEQQAMWHESLHDTWQGQDEHLGTIASQFDFDAPTITAASSLARRFMLSEAPGAAIAHACRLQIQAPLDGFAERIQPRARLADLVLPSSLIGLFGEIASQARNRVQVHEEWGFAQTATRGLGISALFSGPSGTGKTMAAEALANELQQDLYRVDLAAVVSKYIGETEKNLQRVFSAAEQGGVVLLFDEADALFGKRSEVKDSHDRFANLEVSYLLQRMESYRGLAILTTNQRPSIDAAFLRRLRFIVEFPFPDAEQRTRLWQGAFPSGVPIQGLKYERLAQLALAGGSIRNIAINAAFLAAEADQPVTMHHIAHAARSECSKQDRALSPSETEGWS